jgi:hypothetical protein
VASGALFPEGLESALQGPGRGRSGQFMDFMMLQKSFASSRELTCKDFACVSTWRSTSSSAKHGGRARL